MIPETSANKPNRKMNPSEPTVIFVLKNKIVKPSLKYKIHLDDENFDLKEVEALMRVKRIKPSAVKFSTVKFQSGRITNDETMKSLANIIKSATKSTKLEINCFGRPITDQGLGYICKSIRSLTSLKSLDLNFGKCQNIRSLGNPSLAQSLRRFARLQNIGLNFRGEISDQEFQKLVGSLKEIRSLQDIYLNFGWAGHLGGSSVSNISDKAIEKLSLKLKNFMNLQKLHLDFSSLNQITDKGIQSLAQSLKRIASLRSTTLRFEKCSSITNPGIVSLSQWLGKLTWLKSLKLHFFQCPNIGDMGIEGLSEALEKLSCLQRIDLNFGECKKITDIGMKRLKESLENDLFTKS